jgi:hypothetical protein
MKLRASYLIPLLCVAVLSSSSAAGMRAAQATDQRVSVESIVPRDGLQFYFEIRGQALPELVRLGEGLQHLIPAAKGGPSGQEIAQFAMSRLDILIGSKLVLINHRSTGPMIVVETANAPAAGRLVTDLTRLVTPAGLEVSTQSQLVLIASREGMSKLAGLGGSVTLAEDSQFAAARERFAAEPLFGYVEMAGGAMQWPGGAQGSAYSAGVMAALSSMPHAMAMGGSIEGGTARIHALLIQGPKAKQGLFSSLFSSSQAGQATAAGYVAPNMDFFIDLMIDWDKLYDDISSLLGMFASAAATQSNGPAPPSMPTGDLLGAMEASLGFSIKHDLFPALGNELAIGFDTRTLAPAARAAAGRPKPPNLVLLVAVRDRAALEKFIGKLLTAGKGPNAPPPQISRAPYRGTTINSTRSVAYTIYDGFLILSGSAADVRRHVDARAMGTSLASTRDFKSAIGNPGAVSAQIYISARALSSIGHAVPEALKAQGFGAMTLADSSIGVVVTPDPEGQMLEIRIPAKLGLLALASAMKGGSAYGISSGTNGRRRSPTLTNEDLGYRRPR